MPKHKQTRKGCGEDADNDSNLIVTNAVKRALDFSQRLRDGKDKKDALENAVKTVAKKVRIIISTYGESADVDSTLAALAQLQVSHQRTDLPRNLGSVRARLIFELCVGDLSELYPDHVEFVNHDRKAASSCFDPEPSAVHVVQGSDFPCSAGHDGDAVRSDSSDTSHDAWPFTEGTRAPSSSFLRGPVYLLEFARSPKEFFNALMSSPFLQGCRHALELERRSPLLANGAKVFVYPDQYDAVWAAVREWKLKPRHVIVAAEFEADLMKAIENIGKGVLEKSRTALPPPPAVVKRTFIEVPILSSLRSEPLTEAIASTTDANPRTPLRPRRA